MDTVGTGGGTAFIIRMGTEIILGITGIDFYCQRNQRILSGVENIENFNLEKTTNGTENRISTAR